jgi:hypothetical protein
LQLADIIPHRLAIEARNPLMRALLSALAMLALGGFCSQASAQAQCPELTRLRSEAAQAQKPLRRNPMMGGCELYIHSSMAWRAVFEYADENREMCDIPPIHWASSRNITARP